MSTLSDWIPFEEKYCLFLGAGFSKCAANLPTARELFDFNLTNIGSVEEKRIIRLKKIKDSWDKSNPQDNIEEFISHLLEASDSQKKLIIWYIGRRLADPFIIEDYENHRRVIKIDEDLKFEIEGVKKARQLLNHFISPSLEGIITTNYDLLVEYTLGSKAFHYGKKMQKLYGAGPNSKYPFFKATFLTGSLPLLKLHGSISLTDMGYCTDGRGGITGKSLIVPPTHNKKVFKFVEDEWKIAKKVLNNSATLIIFGFAFNEYDTELLQLLKKLYTISKKDHINQYKFHN